MYTHRSSILQVLLFLFGLFVVATDYYCTAQDKYKQQPFLHHHFHHLLSHDNLSYTLVPPSHIP